MDVLVPIDGSDPSMAALEYACTTHPKDTITVLYVSDLKSGHNRFMGAEASVTGRGRRNETRKNCSRGPVRRLTRSMSTSRLHTNSRIRFDTSWGTQRNTISTWSSSATADSMASHDWHLGVSRNEWSAEPRCLLSSSKRTIR